eukprot:NODE_541_length_6897_cov_0.247426.p4 type:complete len:235 gc:universal NODE_541_length_6897_cov_0.247426:6271-5567(-)
MIPNAVSLALWKSKPYNVEIKHYMSNLANGNEELKQLKLKCATLQAEVMTLKRKQESKDGMWSNDIDMQDMDDIPLSDDVIISILRHSKDLVNLKSILLDKVDNPSCISIKALLFQQDLEINDRIDFAKLFSSTLENSLNSSDNGFHLISRCLCELLNAEKQDTYHILIVYLYIGKCTQSITKHQTNLNISDLKLYNSTIQSLCRLSQDLQLFFNDAKLSRLIEIEYHGIFALT